MVIAYFMKHKKLSFHQAFNEVKSKRKIVIELLTLDQPKWRIYQPLERIWTETEIELVHSFQYFIIAIPNILKNTFRSVLQPEENIQLWNKPWESKYSKESSIV